MGRLRSALARLRSNDQGGAMLELAVVLPVLMLIAIGVMDYGRVYYTSVAVSNAARAGAEWGAIDSGHQANSTAIQNFAKLDGVDAGTITVTSQQICKCGSTTVGCTSTCSGLAPNVWIEVTASKSVPMLLKYPGLATTISVSRTATFRLQ
jgi:Flp pilus assembly protein TadG